jgi:hypothetical protein
MPNWEYLILHRNINSEFKGFPTSLVVTYFWDDDPKDSRSTQERLNALGQDGWELVSAYPTALYQGQAWAGMTTSISYILKRSLETKSAG